VTSGSPGVSPVRLGDPICRPVRTFPRSSYVRANGSVKNLCTNVPAFPYSGYVSAPPTLR
jgi:hypothetical protein